MAYLTQEQVTQLVEAVLALPLDYTQVRMAFLAGIDPGFLGLLQGGLPSIAQVRTDLAALDRVPRLASGLVPLRIWLANAALLAGPTDQQAVFQRALDEVSHRTSGSPRIDLVQVPETKEEIVHVDDMVPPSFLDAGLKASISVARLAIPRYDNGQPRTLASGQPLLYLGTGWLLTPELLITNHHVVNARNENEVPASDADLALQAAATRVKFDFDGEGLAGSDSAAIRLEAWAAGALDYAILRLPPTARPGLVRASDALVMKPNDYIPVNIIQHPEGGGKKFAIRNNLVTATTASDIRYFTDTRRGSSGSPVFDDAWRVVGLHRGATLAENVSFQGKKVAYVNIGTQIMAILADLANRYPALAAGL